MQFSTYPTIFNLMSYNQEYNEQTIYELDFQYSEDSKSDTTILQSLYRSYLYTLFWSLSLGTRTGFSVIGWTGDDSSRKVLAPWYGQCRQPSVGVPPHVQLVKPDGWRPLPKKIRLREIGPRIRTQSGQTRQHCLDGKDAKTKFLNYWVRFFKLRFFT